MERLLLHTCCAPCSVYCVESLRSEGLEPVSFWFNPNIHPYQEYKARRDTLIGYESVSVLLTRGASDVRIAGGFRKKETGEGERIWSKQSAGCCWPEPAAAASRRQDGSSGRYPRGLTLPPNRASTAAARAG